jgi:hypothetical protein
LSAAAIVPFVHATTIIIQPIFPPSTTNPSPTPSIVIEDEDEENENSVCSGRDYECGEEENLVSNNGGGKLLDNYDPSYPFCVNSISSTNRELS